MDIKKPGNPDELIAVLYDLMHGHLKSGREARDIMSAFSEFSNQKAAENLERALEEKKHAEQLERVVEGLAKTLEKLEKLEETVRGDQEQFIRSFALQNLSSSDKRFNRKLMLLAILTGSIVSNTDDIINAISAWMKQP